MYKLVLLFQPFKGSRSFFLPRLLSFWVIVTDPSYPTHHPAPTLRVIVSLTVKF